MSSSPSSSAQASPTEAATISSLAEKGPAATRPPSRGILSSEAWTPLKNDLFRSIWVTSLIANIGIWAREASGPWQMSLLKSTPLFVSLVAFASTLPMSLLAIPSGVLSDMFDRRKLLAVTQVWMLLAAAGLGVVISLHLITPGLLLFFTALLGIGSAVSQPPFQAIVPELVPAADMPLAIALNSVALNLARAIGPALAGLIIAYMSVGASFFFTAAAFVPIIIALLRWHRPPEKSAVKPERFFKALGLFFRYARHSFPLLAVQVRVIVFIACAVSMWAMLPSITRSQLHSGAGGQGLIMAFLGVGAIIGVIFMPELQRRLSIDGMVNICTVFYGLGLITLSITRSLWTACPVMVFIGFNWVIVPTNFNIATQRSVPNWVKGRALGLYQTALWGTWAIFAPVWGAVATKTHSVPTALFWSGIGVVVGIAVAKGLKLTYALGQDFTPAKAPLSDVANRAELEGGAVCVAVAYQVEPERRSAFLDLMRALRKQRLRNGAIRWELAIGSSANRIIESFVLASWNERIRHHQRTTKADMELEQRVVALHVGGCPPEVSYSRAALAGSESLTSRLRNHALAGFQREFVRFFDRMDRANGRSPYLRNREPRT